MKKKKDYTLTALLIPFLIAVISCLPGCYGTDKTTVRDYQIEVTNDSTIIYDGNRKVGSLPYEGSKLDSIIDKDNQ
jgi:hypothetical protein